MKVKNKILLVLGVLFCACITVFAVACSGRSVSYTFEEYSFNTGTGEESDWRELDYPDEEIEMDGVVDETAYGTTYLSITDVNGVNMKVYAYMGQRASSSASFPTIQTFTITKTGKFTTIRASRSRSPLRARKI